MHLSHTLQRRPIFSVGNTQVIYPVSNSWFLQRVAFILGRDKTVMAVPCPPTASASFPPLRLLWIFMFTWSAQPGNNAVNRGPWAGHSEREDRVREMSRRLASGRRQHTERLQRNTEPIKDRHSTLNALKGIPHAYPRAWYMLSFYWTKNRKWCNRRPTHHPDSWKEKWQLSGVSDILPLSIQ